MKIDRHNYEEFFILYWDNELTAAQKQAVENFVKENTDLKEEFQILGQTRFTADNNVQFEDKEFLLNNPSINITNYEEQLLNYIDDELSNDERKEVERSLVKYPTIQKELTLLQKTKLQPEQAIGFPDKSTLYRREEKVRVISMTWFRVAVAAAIILIAGVITFRFVNTGNRGDKNEVVKNIDSNKPDLSINKSNDQIAVQPQKKDTADLVKGKEKPVPVQLTNEKKDHKPVNETDLRNTIADYKPENKNNLPKEGGNKNQTLVVPNTTIDGVIADAELPDLKRDDRTTQTNQSQIINTDFDKKDVTLQPKNPLYIPEAEEKEKVGLKEFLRKTTRVFERRTKIQTTTEDNKLLLGAFAVSLK